MSAVAVRVSPTARRSLLALGDAAFAQVAAVVNSLADNPGTGRGYAPAHRAAQTAFDVRVLTAGRYAVYYSVGADGRTTYVRLVEDGRAGRRCLMS